MTTETTMNTAPETAYIGATTDGIVVAFSRGGFPSGRANITRPTTPQARRLWDDALAALDSAKHLAYAVERSGLGGKRAAAEVRAAAVSAAYKRATDVLIYASFVRA